MSFPLPSMAPGDFEWRPISFGLWSKVSITDNEGAWSPGGEHVCGKSFSGLLASSNLGYFINLGTLGSSIHMIPAASHPPLPNQQGQAHHLPAAITWLWGMVQFPKKVLFSPSLASKQRAGRESDTGWKQNHLCTSYVLPKVLCTAAG